MSNYSSKVTQFLKDNPDFEKHAREAYTAAKKFKVDDYKSIKPETKAGIEKRFGATIDGNKLAHFSSIAQKLNEHEFVSWIAGDTDALPAIQLNQAEMALVKGGGGGYLTASQIVALHPEAAPTLPLICGSTSRRWS